MLSLLTSIADIIASLFAFIVNSISSFLHLLAQLPTYTAYLTSAISFAPHVVQPFLIASLSAFVIMFILGRQAC